MPLFYRAITPLIFLADFANLFSRRFTRILSATKSAYICENLLIFFSLINADSFPLITLILCDHLSEIIFKILFH